MIVFVYGTLKQGFYNHTVLGDSKYLGKAKTDPKFTMLHLGGYPGVVAAGDTSISGELYDVDGKILRDLDRLESHPNFYRRTPVTVQGDTGPLDVETYLLPLEWLDRESRVIDSGDWSNKR